MSPTTTNPNPLIQMTQFPHVVQLCQAAALHPLKHGSRRACTPQAPRLTCSTETRVSRAHKQLPQQRSGAHASKRLQLRLSQGICIH